MILLGVALTVLAAGFLAVSFLRSAKVCPYPAYGLAGLAVIAIAELLLYLDVHPVPVYFTPVVWSGYILAVDGAVFAIRGRSLIRSDPQAFVWMAILSIFTWLIFEAYNLRLRNWTYVGLPPNEYLRYPGYGWSFATITPAILETAEFLMAAVFRGGAPPTRTSGRREGELGLEVSEPEGRRQVASWGWMALGVVLVTVPAIVPLDWAVYLFGLVWLGFILVLDPVNDRAGRPSVWNDVRCGYQARLYALLASGAICGILWEFWNYWAAAKWFYIFPILENWRLFEMPLPGFLGFPPFAVELFALYVLAARVLRLPCYEIGRPVGSAG